MCLSKSDGSVLWRQLWYYVGVMGFKSCKELRDNLEGITSIEENPATEISVASLSPPPHEKTVKLAKIVWTKDTKKIPLILKFP